MQKEAFKDLLSQHADDALILDIREPEELEALSSIKGTTHMPMGKVFTEAGQGNLPKDKKIVLVCRSGGRCQIVADVLGPKGFDIDYLEGGMNAWNED